MEQQTVYIDALIKLHGGLKRQGPGDEDFSRRILDGLRPFPVKPRIADLGCGTGAAALLLAEYFHSSVLAVDLASAFLAELRVEARSRGLDHLITVIEADMGHLDWPDASIDLLWSEGAAYNLGFACALRLWRRLLVDGGKAVISEMSWFAEKIPPAVSVFWNAAYPTMARERDNIAHAERAGFKVLATHRLPSALWWSNYYDPLMRRVDEIRAVVDPVMQSVIQETETEMDLFRQFSDLYGYTFYILEAH